MTPRGRPRGFDRDDALRRSMRRFWEQGYETTSVGELTAELGIAAPSLYAAFGSKEQLFEAALELYEQTEAVSGTALREAPTARDAVAALLRRNAEAYVAPGNPRGCMIVQAAATLSPEHDRLRRWLDDNRAAVRAAVRERLDRGVAEGELPAATDTVAVAAFYVTVLEGLSLQARGGASREELLDTADRAVAAWDAVVGL